MSDNPEQKVSIDDRIEAHTPRAGVANEIAAAKERRGRFDVAVNSEVAALRIYFEGVEQLGPDSWDWNDPCVWEDFTTDIRGLLDAIGKLRARYHANWEHPHTP